MKISDSRDLDDILASDASMRLTRSGGILSVTEIPLEDEEDEEEEEKNEDHFVLPSDPQDLRMRWMKTKRCSSSSLSRRHDLPLDDGMAKNRRTVRWSGSTNRRDVS